MEDLLGGNLNWRRSFVLDTCRSRKPHLRFFGHGFGFRERERERESVCEEEEKRWWKSDGAQDFSLSCSLCECLYGFSLTIAVTNNIYIGIYVKSAAFDS